jgi:hypothetical protein
MNKQDVAGATEWDVLPTSQEFASLCSKVRQDIDEAFRRQGAFVHVAASIGTRRGHGNATQLPMSLHTFCCIATGLLPRVAGQRMSCCGPVNRLTLNTKPIGLHLIL